MKNFFNRYILMQADDGTGGGGATDDSSNTEGTDANDQGGDDSQVDVLDQPMFSKRQVAGMISGRVNEVKKNFANHNELQNVASMIGDIIGNQDFNEIASSIKNLHSQHRAKTGQPVVTAPTVNSQQADLKRQATEAEFDNSFVTNPDYADAELFRDEIIDMTQNGFSLAQAYWAVAGPLAANKAASNAEQVAINKQRNKQSKQVIPGNTGNPGRTGTPVIPANIQAAARKFGMDPEEYVAWSGVSTLEQAQALKGKK